jgi:hypothetical protein
MIATRKPIDIAFPLFLLEEGYRKFLMTGLGEMVFRTLSGLVNDWRERTESVCGYACSRSGYAYWGIPKEW